MNKNRNDLTVLKLIFTGLQFKELYINGRFIGYKLTDGQAQVPYILSPKFWNVYLPPMLEFKQAVLPSPEAKIKALKITILTRWIS